MSLDDDLNAGTEDIRYHSAIGDAHTLASISHRKLELLLLIVAHDGAVLDDASYAHRLHGTGSTLFQFAHSHIISGIRLRIGIYQIHDSAENGDANKKETEWYPLARRHSSLYIISTDC